MIVLLVVCVNLGAYVKRSLHLNDLRRYQMLHVTGERGQAPFPYPVVIGLIDIIDEMEDECARQLAQ